MNNIDNDESFMTPLNEDERRMSDSIDNNFRDNHALSEEIIIERIFHGNAEPVKEIIKELDDIHVKTQPGGKFLVSRYSEEKAKENELIKQQNEELKKANQELRNEFTELKNLIIEKLK